MSDTAEAYAGRAWAENAASAAEEEEATCGNGEAPRAVSLPPAPPFAPLSAGEGGLAVTDCTGVGAFARFPACRMALCAVDCFRSLLMRPPPLFPAALLERLVERGVGVVLEARALAAGVGRLERAPADTATATISASEAESLLSLSLLVSSPARLERPAAGLGTRSKAACLSAPTDWKAVLLPGRRGG